MKKSVWVLPVLLILAIFLFISCATTSTTSVWKDADYKDQIRKVFVIGITHKPRIRKFFEDEFVRQLKSSGVNAVASYEILPDIRRLDRESIRSKIRSLDIDTVLITKIVDRIMEKGYETTYIPAAGDHDIYVYVAGTGATFEDERVMLKTNLYNSKNESLIWSVSSETYLMENRDRYKETGKFIQVMMKQMKKDKLIN